MRLRASMTWPFYDIHVTTAFVNPFTSDAVAEPTGMCLNDILSKGQFGQLCPYKKASSASMLLVHRLMAMPYSPCLSFISACLRHIHRLAEPSRSRQCTYPAGKRQVTKKGRPSKNIPILNQPEAKPENVISLHSKASKLWGISVLVN